MITIFPLLGAVLFILVCAILILYARWNYGILEASGLPVLKPTFLLGSVPNLHTIVHAEEDMRLYKKFGPNWALYEGRSPVVFITDPEICKLIFVQDVDYFYNRRVDHFHDKRVDEMLDYLPGEKWRKLRRLETKLYSPSMVKNYNPTLVQAAMDHISLLKCQCRNGLHTIDVGDAMDMLCLDGLFRVSFRVKLENFDSLNNQFYKSLKTALGQGQEFNWLYTLSMSFPFLSKLAPTYNVDDVIFDTFRSLVNTRRQEKEKALQENPSQQPENGEKFKDLCDLLVYCCDQVKTLEYQRLGITEITMLAQALNIASLDMGTATQTVMAYHLAANPKIQEKLYSEIVRVIDLKYNGRIDSETVNKIPYLSACVDEALRIAPPIVRSERLCNKDWTSPDGNIFIKKGVTVMSPLWAAFRNPEYFPEPDVFNPERFLKDKNNVQLRHPYAFTPFGLGPRTCIGVNLAVETLKVNMCLLVKNFRYSLRHDSRLALKPGSLYLLQFHPVNLDIEMRN